MKTIDLIVDHLKTQGELEIFTYEVESEEGRYIGHSCVDIHCRYKLNPLKLKNTSYFFGDLTNYLDNLKEFFIDPLIYTGRFTQFFDKELIKTWVIDHRPFQENQESWVFVLDSKSAVIKSEAGDAIDYKGFKDINEYLKAVDEKIKNDGEELFKAYLNTYKQVSPSMWLSLTDPTVFVLDESYHKFDLPDGWSNIELANLIDYYFKVMYPGIENKYKIVYKDAVL